MIIIVAILVVGARGASFVFPDFNDTQGLTFNGDAATTSCADLEVTRLAGDVEGDADLKESELGVRGMELERHIAKNHIGNGASFIEYKQTTTDDPVDTERVGQRFAVLGHRDDYQPSKETRCAGRMRLTPSNPSAAGSSWYHLPIPVNEGFETLFTFQISDHSRECSTHRDPAFSTLMYTNCHVHGGDGFAFVLHRDANDTWAVGSDGRGLGYAGIRNSLAVEFDTFYNPDGIHPSKPMGSDLFVDHVAVHSRGSGDVALEKAREAERAGGPGRTFDHRRESGAAGGSDRTIPNSDDEAFALGQQFPHPIADGRRHLVKITYLPFVAMEYLEYFTASRHLLPFLKDNSESRRLGTLLVFLDEGVATDEPLLAVPVNMGVLLALPQDQAYVGFTASTGLKWQKHDILSWVWCARLPCTAQEHAAAAQQLSPHDGGGAPFFQKRSAGGREDATSGNFASFDYAQSSSSSSKAAAVAAGEGPAAGAPFVHVPRYVPGLGFGGGGIGGGSISASGAGPKLSAAAPGKHAAEGGGAALSTRHESPDGALLESRGGSAARHGKEHGHGAAAFVPLHHFSKDRNEGLLKSYIASSDTYSTFRGNVGGADAQVPQPPKIPPYDEGGRTAGYSSDQRPVGTEL